MDRPSHLSEPVSGAWVMPFAHRPSQGPFLWKKWEEGRVCSLLQYPCGPLWCLGTSWPGRVQHAFLTEPASPGSTLTSCSERKPSPCLKFFSEASLQRPTRWQGPVQTTPPSAIRLAWPGTRGHSPCCWASSFHLRHSNSVQSGYATLVLPLSELGLGNPSPETLSLRRASPGSGDPPVSAGEEAELLRVHTHPALLASSTFRMDRTSSIAYPGYTSPRLQTSSLILSSLREPKQTPHFPNGVSNCYPCTKHYWNESPPDSSARSNSRIFPS